MKKKRAVRDVRSMAAECRFTLRGTLYVTHIGYGKDRYEEPQVWFATD
jgi:hypothetical protein